jgi:hypothetical protein
MVTRYTQPGRGCLELEISASRDCVMVQGDGEIRTEAQLEACITTLRKCFKQFKHLEPNRNQLFSRTEPLTEEQLDAQLHCVNPAISTGNPTLAEENEAEWNKERQV